MNGPLNAVANGIRITFSCAAAPVAPNASGSATAAANNANNFFIG